MRFMTKIPFIPLTLAFVCAFVNGAQATVIVNLDKKPYVMKVEMLRRVSEVTLAPGERWQTDLYPVRVQIGDYVSSVLQPEGEYAIWSGGTFALQKRDQRFISHH